jgi:hypothetical protein
LREPVLASLEDAIEPIEVVISCESRRAVDPPMIAASVSKPRSRKSKQGTYQA